MKKIILSILMGFLIIPVFTMKADAQGSDSNNEEFEVLPMNDERIEGRSPIICADKCFRESAPEINNATLKYFDTRAEADSSCSAGWWGTCASMRDNSANPEVCPSLNAGGSCKAGTHAAENRNHCAVNECAYYICDGTEGPPSLSGDTTFSNDQTLDENGQKKGQATLTIKGGRAPYSLILSGEKTVDNEVVVPYYTANIIEEGEGENKTYKVVVPAQPFNTDCGLKLKVKDACGNENEEAIVDHTGGDWIKAGELGSMNRECFFTSPITGEQVTIPEEKGKDVPGSANARLLVTDKLKVYEQVSLVVPSFGRGSCPENGKPPCLDWECSDVGNIFVGGNKSCCLYEREEKGDILNAYMATLQRSVWERQCTPPILPETEPETPEEPECELFTSQTIEFLQTDYKKGQTITGSIFGGDTPTNWAVETPIGNPN